MDEIRPARRQGWMVYLIDMSTLREEEVRGSVDLPPNVPRTARGAEGERGVH